MQVGSAAIVGVRVVETRCIAGMAGYPTTVSDNDCRIFTIFEYIIPHVRDSYVEMWRELDCPKWSDCSFHSSASFELSERQRAVFE